MPTMLHNDCRRRAGQNWWATALPARRQVVRCGVADGVRLLTGRVARVVLVLVASLLCVLPARADIYGFIDERGVIHFADRQLDERYSLFFRAGETVDTQRLRRGPAGSMATQSLPVAPPVIEATPLPEPPKSRFLERVMQHPNILRFDALVDDVAREYGLDPALLRSVIAVESGYEPTAVSPKGAIGLMQVIPATGERYGLRGDVRRTLEQKLADPLVNVRIGARYLADLRKMFADDLDLVLAAYNAGENAVKRYRNAIPPFPETQSYVRLVRELYRYFRPPPVVVQAPPVTVPQVQAQPARVRMTLSARRNMPDPARLQQVEAARQGSVTLAAGEPLVVPALPAPPVLQVPPLSSVDAIEVPALADAWDRPAVSRPVPLQ